MKWIDVSTGWSHVVVWGITNGRGDKKIYIAWGRNDMGQLSCCGENNCSNTYISLPQIVHAPIEDYVEKPLKQITCGSEYTLSLSYDGRLFGCGWNEHGNLGTGDVINGREGWREVIVDTNNYHQENEHDNIHTHQSQPIAVAAGGAHCLVSLH